MLFEDIFPTSLDQAFDRVPSPLPVSSSSMIYLPSYALGQVQYMKRTGLGAECYAAVGTSWKYMRHGQRIGSIVDVPTEGTPCPTVIRDLFFCRYITLKFMH